LSGQDETIKGLLEEVRDALYGGNRAFVFVRNIEAHKQKSADAIAHWIFFARWENGGNTPKKNMRNRTNYSLRENPIDLGFEFPDFGDQPSGRPMIGPKSFMHSSYFDISVEHLQKVKMVRRTRISGGGQITTRCSPTHAVTEVSSVSRFMFTATF
jgi:hypothetical protein